MNELDLPDALYLKGLWNNTPAREMRSWQCEESVIHRWHPGWTRSGSLMMWPAKRPLNRLSQTISWMG